MAVKTKNKYRNKKTGAVIETVYKISGDNWEKVKTGNRKLDSDGESEDNKEDE